mmetsp:Transcript_5877/g.16709  ORF Transcript_5877/g.16709 Transcript_5877/m.16709 type:complete len:256 (-) Transcript_5877:372-1139(-)
MCVPQAGVVRGAMGDLAVRAPRHVPWLGDLLLRGRPARARGAQRRHRRSGREDHHRVPQWRRAAGHQHLPGGRLRHHGLGARGPRPGHHHGRGRLPAARRPLAAVHALRRAAGGLRLRHGRGGLGQRRHAGRAPRGAGDVHLVPLQRGPAGLAGRALDQGRERAHPGRQVRRGRASRRVRLVPLRVPVEAERGDDAQARRRERARKAAAGGRQLRHVAHQACRGDHELRRVRLPQRGPPARADRALDAPGAGRRQ